MVKLIGFRAGLKRMEEFISRMWAKDREVTIMDLMNDFFVVRFSNIDDFDRVVKGGPWMMMDHYLVIR